MSRGKLNFYHISCAAALDEVQPLARSRSSKNNALSVLFVQNKSGDVHTDNEWASIPVARLLLFTSLNYWCDLRQDEKKRKEKNRAYPSLHLKSEQSCVTEMKKEEDAPFLSRAAGGAPRFIQMLQSQNPRSWSPSPAHSQHLTKA